MLNDEILLPHLNIHILLDIRVIRVLEENVHNEGCANLTALIISLLVLAREQQEAFLLYIFPRI
jgi:hypothetical protein